MTTAAESPSRRAAPSRTALGALTFVLLIGMAGCGRRGPPLAPIQVDPETPRVLPLLQEDGQVVVRWYAPRLDSGGDPAELRLRKAIVSYRLVDLQALAAEERASRRQPPEEADEEEFEESTSADEDTTGTSEPEDSEPETEEEPAPEAEPEAVEAPAEGESAPRDPDAPGTAEPETEEPLPEPAPSGEAPAPDQPPPAPVEEPSTAGEALPEEPEPEPEPGPEPEPAEAPEPEPAEAREPEPGPEPAEAPELEPGPESAEAPESEPQQGPETAPEETGEEPDTGEPPGGETGGDDPAQPPEPEPEVEPEPAGVLLDYEELEFEVLSEIESEVPGEERVLELPVEPDWIGRRLEITIRYEARRGASEESEIRSLDVTGPLPAVEGISVDVGPSELTVRWQDPRPGLDGPLSLSDPVFEVFRRRGEESERLGRSFGPQQADREVVWGEETCYRARLVIAGTEEESVIPDPGPVPPDGAGADESAGEATAADVSAEAAAAEGTAQDLTAAEASARETTAAGAGGEEAPAAAETGEGGVSGLPAGESGDPPGEAALPEQQPESEEAPWDPIPIRVPGAGSGAASVGPLSAEACVTPVDEFPPLPPSDLRLFWQAQQTDLSWRESTSTDVVGYHVYRTGPDGTGFARLTEFPVEQTSFTDAARDPRGAYRYAITAVDGAASPNESLPSDSRTVNPR